MCRQINTYLPWPSTSSLSRTINFLWLRAESESQVVAMHHLLSPSAYFLYALCLERSCTAIVFTESGYECVIAFYLNWESICAPVACLSFVFLSLCRYKRHKDKRYSAQESYKFRCRRGQKNYLYKWCRPEIREKMESFCPFFEA